jgi:hypothetical protein
MEYKQLPTIQEAFLLADEEATPDILDLMSPEHARQIAHVEVAKQVFGEYTTTFLKRFKKSFDAKLIQIKGNTTVPFNVYVFMTNNPAQTLDAGWLNTVEKALGRHGLRTNGITSSNIDGRRYCITIVPIDWDGEKSQEGGCAVM